MSTWRLLVVAVLAGIVSFATAGTAVPAASPDVTVTVLIENSALDQPPGLVAEHGFSFLVEKGKDAVLFDTGMTGAAFRNARTLGVDLDRVRVVVISHAHFDHSGGLAEFLRTHPKSVAYLHPAAKGEFVGVGKDHEHVIGIDPGVFREFGERIRLVSQVAEVVPDVFVLTPIPKIHPAPQNPNLYKRVDGKLLPDDFAHEIGLAVRGRRGLVVLSGCSHTGVLNVIDAARQKFPGVPLNAVVGGFHLANPFTGALSESPEYVQSVGRALNDSGARTVCTGHCTGSAAMVALHDTLGDTVRTCPAGTRLTF